MRRILLLATLLTLLTALPAAAGKVSKKASFELDTWWNIEVTDGPVTIHRLRLERQGGFTKSKIFRPGNNKFLDTVQFQIEYSNSSTNDWDADINLYWKDAEGNVIDGYEGEEDLNEEERHEVQTVTLSTLKYGLERARTIEIEISFHPE